jgi:hypothetical protein
MYKLYAFTIRFVILNKIFYLILVRLDTACNARAMVEPDEATHKVAFAN